MLKLILSKIPELRTKRISIDKNNYQEIFHLLTLADEYIDKIDINWHEAIKWRNLGYAQGKILGEWEGCLVSELDDLSFKDFKDNYVSQYPDLKSVCNTCYFNIK